MTAGAPRPPEQVTSASPLLYRVTEAMRVLGLGRTAIYDLIRTGRIRSVKQGRSRLIPASALVDYVVLLEREAGEEQ
ncbi:helix-turn-helix domain-containing protein [Streptomyces sp. NPDC020799]|uniref:helix-turn-helix domain-containing protein n=1 Tax=unclassified Streptomyces TaxID=2593676 RepID=UPI0033FD55B1